MKTRLTKISIEPGHDPLNKSIRLEFNNERFYQADILGPYIEHVEDALLLLLKALRDDHNLRETKKE